MRWLLNRLVAAFVRQANPERWHGFRLLAIDSTTLTLPETPPLWKRFGSHRGKKGLGPVGAEFACLFHLATCTPIDYCLGKAATSDHSLIKRLFPRLRNHDLLLIDCGFYYLNTFLAILDKEAEFLIPSKSTHRPKVVRKLAASDYLCHLDSKSYSLLVRVIYVERKGFRRRRLVTSLLDPQAFPAADLAELYHLRWRVETFYRDFKHTLGANHWHCRTPRTFEQELAGFLIIVCLMRQVMYAAAQQAGVEAARLSTARCLTQTRIWFRRLGRLCLSDWATAYRRLVETCSRFLVAVKPGRSFSRDRQEYRRKSRGLEPKGGGRTPAPVTATTRSKQEVRSDNCLLP